MKLKIAVDGKTFEVEVEVLEGGDSFLSAGAGGGRPIYTPAAKRISSGPQRAPAASPIASKNACTSPLAGNVWKVLVEPGQKVTLDETVVVIEAMKMETAIAAPLEGTVSAVHVKPGDAVKVNQVLVELE